MRKKIILISLISILVLAGAGLAIFWVYNNWSKSSVKILEPPKNLLKLEIEGKDLSAETVQRFQKDFDEVKTILEKNPRNFNNLLFLGVIKKSVGDYKGARDVLEYAGQLRPKSSTPFSSLADLYGYFLNDPQKAEANFLKALENDPYSYSIFLNLADFYRYKYLGKEDLYDKVLLSGLERIPEEVNIIAALAAYYRETGQTDKAITFYERLLKLNPSNETAKEDLAELKK